jgi:hypothetical protein
MKGSVAFERERNCRELSGGNGSGCGMRRVHDWA